MKSTKSRAPSLLLVLFASLWLLPIVAAAQVEEAHVRIDGMV